MAAYSFLPNFESRKDIMNSLSLIKNRILYNKHDFLPIYIYIYIIYINSDE